MSSPKKITKPEDIKIQSLRGTSFTTSDPPVKDRLICSIDGESGAGKNRLAFTFPDPIAFLSFDPNYGTALEDARKNLKKKIHRAPYNMPVITPDGRDTERISQIAGDLWDRVATDFMGAVRDPAINTIVIDTATELFELIKLALYGKVAQVIQRDLGHAYATYRQFIREVENTGKNLVLLHKMKDEYRADKPTGNRIRAAYKDTAYIVTAEFFVEKIDGEPFPDRYHCRLYKCHLRPDAEWDGNGNGELQGDMISYDNWSEVIFS